MKKIILLFCLVVLPMSAAQKASEENPFLHDDHFPGGYFLMPDSMPHFMGIYMKEGGMQKIKPSTEQEKVIEKQFEKMVKIIMSTATKIKSMETVLTLDIVHKGKTAKELSAQIDEVAKLRKELTILQIECINLFKETLTKEQYKQMLELALTQDKKR